ncbi:MAG: EAL and HDOD domain-containing protein, partial [Phycisphaerae bacterium]
MQGQNVALEVFVARQPIFHPDQTVHGYELLFRSSRENRFDGTDPDTATLEVLTNTFTAIGLEDLTDGRWAFVNFSETLLQRDIPRLLPRDAVTIEILETVEPTPDVRQACELLHALGYRLAVDDFVGLDPRAELLDLADVVKVDFGRVVPAEREGVCRKHVEGGL